MTTATTIATRAAADLAAFRAVMAQHGVMSTADLCDSDAGEDVLDDAYRRGLVTLGNFDAAQDDEPVLIADGPDLKWAITINRRHYVVDESGSVEEWEGALMTATTDEREHTMTTTITFAELTDSSIDEVERVELNRALRDDLAPREPSSTATTEINGGDVAIITDADGDPMTVAAVLCEVDAFLADAEV